jgi:serine phosphatase RsbU (regulator of sigma subunit)
LVRERLRLLSLLGVLLTMAVAGTALFSLAQVSEINHAISEIGQAQRYHQDADMMHDALRGDVGHALELSSGVSDIPRAQVRRETGQHASRFRADLTDVRELDIPVGLTRALVRLHPAQERYIVAAEQIVRSVLRGSSPPPSARARFEESFHGLVLAQQDITRRIVSTAARTQRAADREQVLARRRVAVSSAGALAGWLIMLVLLRRSTGHLHAALTRESEQRAAADLLQRSLLPQRLPVVPGAQLAARSLPGESGLRVGGDWYDVIGLPTGEVGLVIGDVVGHGLPAATVMGQLRNALRAYALEDTSPAGVLERVNRASDLLDVAEMATCLYAVWEPRTLRLRWANAGHMPPLLSTAAGAGRLLCAEPGPPLGAAPTAGYQDHELRLEPGDTLVLYTDGLVERRGASIDQGLAALEALPGGYADAETLCNALLDRLLTRASPGTDDVTVLLLRTEDETHATPAPASPAAVRNERGPVAVAGRWKGFNSI